MNVINQYIPKSATGRRPQKAMAPIYITIHGTGNPRSTAKNEADNVCNNEPQKQTSFHIVVDDKEAYKVIPLNEIAWHAGDGKNGTGNTKSISIEICESGDRQKALLNAISIVHDLMLEYKIGINGIKRHYDWTKKNCPRILLDKGFIVDGMDWNWFLAKLKQSLEPDYKTLYETAKLKLEQIEKILKGE